jgi:hypothetical protein
MKDLFYECTVKKILITKKRTIYAHANFFAKTKECNWSDRKNAQLLITKSWVDKYYFRSEDVIVPIVPSAPIIHPSVPLVQKEGIRQDLSERKEDKKVIENVPPILELRDEEKFHDINGNVVDIETRGERHRNKIYFKVKDVINTFNMPSLVVTLNDKRCNYERGLHYTCFIHNSKNEETNKPFKKSLYLTYKGLLRVLFNSRSGNAEKFSHWAENKIFAIQMGTTEAKKNLGTDKPTSDVSCVYLLSFGKVGALRETFRISVEIDDDIVVHFKKKK